jgi:hypothetical protein
MRRERPRGCATVQRLEHRRLDLEVPELVERATQCPGHGRTRAKKRSHLGMHREVRVTLTVSLLRIGESRVANGHAVHHLFLSKWQRTQRLGQQLHVHGAHRHFARSRTEKRPADADHVADVEVVQLRVGRIAQLVSAKVELDAPRVIGEMREGRFSVRAPRDNAAGNAHRVPFVVLVGRMKTNRVRGVVRPIETIRERADALRDQGIELLASRLLHEVQIFAHAAALPPDAPFCDRYASMNSSMSPSMMRWTSGILSSVRWSLTMV